MLPTQWKNYDPAGTYCMPSSAATKRKSSSSIRIGASALAELMTIIPTVRSAGQRRATRPARIARASRSMRTVRSAPPDDELRRTEHERARNSAALANECCDESREILRCMGHARHFVVTRGSLRFCFTARCKALDN